MELVSDKQTQRVFAGEGRRIAFQFRNPTPTPLAADLRTRLYQASSATAAPLGEAPWKKLTILPGQTVLESGSLTFPAVEAETRFLVQWLEGTNKVFGTAEVLAYPTNLLKELKRLAGDAPLSVLDPANQLKPLLKSAAVEYQDLEDSALEDYKGKLAILGPFQSRAQVQEGLANHVKALAEKGVAVVWIQPPPEKRAGLKPSYYTVLQGKGAVLVVQASVVANLAEAPQAQLNLIELARLALRPEPSQLPQQAEAH